MRLSRRQFLKVGAATGGGILVSVYLPGCESSPQQDIKWARDDFTPTAWIRISKDNVITFYIHRSEMGQGVTTALPMLIAEELDVELEKINLEFAPVHSRFNSPRTRMMMTGGSTSVAESFIPLRKAGATARHLLIMAAGKTWGIPVSKCSTKNGRVFENNGHRSLSYGELSVMASTLYVDDSEVKLKSDSEFRYIGKPVSRLDNKIKTDGSAEFGIDIQFPDILSAVVLREPWFGAELESFDASRAVVMQGVQAVFNISSGVAVVADGYWHARKASEAVELSWTKEGFANKSEENLRQEMKSLAEQKGRKLLNVGDFQESFSTASSTLEVSYRVPHLAHAQMEPMNCTAHVQKDCCDIWVPTQAPSSARAVAAAICGLKLDQVNVHTTYLGGGFGRRAMQDFVSEAVEVSKKLRKPVKVVWSREDDMRHDYYRPPAYSVLKAGINKEGMPVAWFHRLVTSSVIADAIEDGFVAGAFPAWVPGNAKKVSADIGAQLLRRTNEPISTEGGVAIPYSIPNQRVERVNYDFPVPLGIWRSVGHSHTAFMVESFIDELAHLGKKDPFQYRLQLLEDKPRHRGVLMRVAEMAKWRVAPEDGLARGIAQHASFGSYVAQVAEVFINKNNQLRVKKVFCAIDCGQVVNPDIVKAQMESGIIFGLTAALKGEITIKSGGVAQSNFHDYPLLRMNEVPEIEVSIISSREPPTGAGEPGTPPIAPAVCNAIFALTGHRYRELPLVKAAAQFSV